MRTRSSPQPSANLRTEARQADERQRSHPPNSDTRALLLTVGMRPTRRRMMLARIIFDSGDRHITAEMLYQEAAKAGIPVSLATIYNTLRQFQELGLLRQVGVGGSKTYFDTNLSHHHHFFLEEDYMLLDIPSSYAALLKEPLPPNGYEIASVDMLVRLRRIIR